MPKDIAPGVGDTGAGVGTGAGVVAGPGGGAAGCISATCKAEEERAGQPGGAIGAVSADPAIVWKVA